MACCRRKVKGVESAGARSGAARSDGQCQGLKFPQARRYRAVGSFWSELATRAHMRWPPLNLAPPLAEFLSYQARISPLSAPRRQGQRQGKGCT